ncbi:hypothetical protein CAEBREN_17697 [Caenorhabditis brenneri]|uniref:GH18 domain-containing protein n=1 Tax=Caenorhabditis brenneri TaxID=135651 RepID=G0NAJ0_CAEBE|nr:hypothetical protein CAEBREN_17697 [Caenorhabditis brenneri]
MAGVVALCCTYILFYFSANPTDAKSKHLQNSKINNSKQIDFQKTTSLVRHQFIPASSCGKRILSYQRGWEVNVERRQLEKLTHLVFAFVSMNSNGDVSLSTNSMRASLLDMKMKSRAVKNEVKMMVAIGGAGGSQHFSSVISDKKKRKNFIESISSFLLIHQIDGVDIYWIWPEGKDSDNIVTFMKELRTKFTDLATSQNREDPYIISMVIPRKPSLLEALTRLDEVLEFADFLNALTFDYFGPAWYPETGPVAPLFSGMKGKEKCNVDYTMKYLTCQTKKPNQLNMAVEFVGRYWKNVKGAIEESDEMWRMTEPVNGTIQGETFSWKTLESGAFDKTSAVWHDPSKSSYIWIPEKDIFVTFEGERSLMEKMDYAKTNNFGGIIIWTVGSDDDEDTLLNLVSSYNLCTNNDKNAVNYDC